MGIGNWEYFLSSLTLNVLSISTREAIEKYLMDILYISSAFLLLFEGLISLALFIIFFIIMQLIPCSPNQNPKVFEELCFNAKWELLKKNFMFLFNFSSIETLYIWGFVLFNYAMNHFRIYTNEKLTPTHRYVSEILLIFYWFIYNCSKDIIKNETHISKYMGVVIDSFILILACSIYNEFIIVHICNLQADTRQGIEKRGRMDISITTKFNVSDEEEKKDCIED